MQKPNDKKASYDSLVLLLVIVAAAWALGGLVVYWANDKSDRGPFGDMFGAVNALFSGCAFAALIYTIRQQSDELALQREELRLTRQELSGQRVQMESQAETLKLQQLETTFFQLLRVHDDIVNAIDLVGSRTRKGRDCFKFFVDKFKEIYAADTRNHTGLEARERIRRAYEIFYKDAEAEVGHYFRHLYHIIKFVDESPIEDKRRYTSFVRAQLSAYEIQLLFYNCLSDHGVERFKPLVERYGLLKHLPRMGFYPIHREYLPSAYLPATPKRGDLEAIGAADRFSYVIEAAEPTQAIQVEGGIQVTNVHN